jgi:hypothetical protein
MVWMVVAELSNLSLANRDDIREVASQKIEIKL